jgi:hypothetical protein
MNWEQSYKLLLNGDYDNGWPSHDIIPCCTPSKGTQLSSNFDKPVWDGTIEPIVLLINAEFGDGDVIHFWRFVEHAKKRVKKVILRCNEELHELLSGVDFVANQDPLPCFDKVIHMMALPKVLGIKKNDINGVSYLAPNHAPRMPVGVLSLLNVFKVGVCWAGNPFCARDHLRSIPVELFEPFKPEAKLKFFTLNKLFKPPEKFIDVRPLMRDWNETAHLIRVLDLVITVETAVALLAGAMGKPVWMLTPDQPDWRFGLSGETTLWYDSMKLYRQNGSWQKTIDRAAGDLKELVSSLSDKKAAVSLGGSCEGASTLFV